MGHPQDLWLLKPHRRSADFSAIKLLIEEIVDAHLSAFSWALFVTRLLAVLVLVFVPLELYKNTEISARCGRGSDNGKHRACRARHLDRMVA
jgi:hypothetical protein